MKTPRFVRRGSRPFLAPTFTVLSAAILLAGCHRKAEADAPKTILAQNTVAPATAPATPADPAAPAPATNAPASADATAAAPTPPPPMPSEFNWPRTYKDGTTTLLVYQPEIEKWDGASFVARFAVSIQEAGAQVPTFGVIWVSATSNVDKEAGVVTLTNLSITKTNFPTEQPDAATKYAAFLTAQLPAQSLPIPLAQISNRWQLSKALKQVATQPVKNTVPRIIFSNQPALLVPVDGTPVMRPLAGTDYTRVFNTNALIVQAANNGPFYLRAMNYWYTSPSVEGPWTTDFQPIPELPAIEQAAAAIPSIDPINPPKGQNPPAPDIYVSTTPTELIQTQGPPEFVPIRDTELLEVKNSDNAIILNIGNQLFYVLISGRWFSSPALTGQAWAYVPGDKLPADFAKIPANSDKGNVLLSVPGTPQAQEAVIANSIPQTATVNRQQANLEVTYDGVPQFQPVVGTSLQYAVNTASPVIEVSPSSYYAVSNGVWFTAAAPVGPWAAATFVPPAIYTIPVSSPVHYVTYVQVYGYTDTTVTVGYTPGYYGTVVAPSGVVVYGSGYVYPPYVGTTVYVAPPATYGYGAGFSDGAATGFLFGFAAGAVLGACLAPSYGCWGTWGGNTYNTTINNGNVYNHWGNNVVAHGGTYNGWHGGGEAGAGFNPYNGNWAAGQRGAGYNSATGTYGAGRSGAVGNAYTGNYAAGRQGAAYNPSTGRYAAGESGVEGNKYTGNFNGGRQGEVGNVNTGRSASGSTSFSGNAYNGNWNANQNRSYNDSKTGASASSSKSASGNAYNGTASSTTDRSATAANGSSVNSTVDKSTGQPTTRSGSAYNANTGKTTDWDHTQGQGASSTPSHAYSDSSGNVYKPSSSGGYQKATTSGWQDTPKAQTPQNVQRQSQGWGGEHNEGGGGGLTQGGWGGGDHNSSGGGGGDRWGGNDGGGGWGNRDSSGGDRSGGGGWDRGGGGGGGWNRGGGGGFSRGGGGGRGWR